MIPALFTTSDDLPGEQIVETVKVRFPCEEHGRWFRHPVDTRKPKWVWCDGGETKLLRQTTLKDATVMPDDTMWVEV
jgi:hypothetical protein